MEKPRHVANPWTHPLWFLEDIWDLLAYYFERYISCSPVFRVCWYIFLAYVALRTYSYFRNDYLRYVSLRRGGRASNVFGWLWNKFYQFVAMGIFRVNVLSTPVVHPLEEPDNGMLYGVPQRAGPRPDIVGVIGDMPQRAGGSPFAMQWISQRFRDTAQQDPCQLRFQRSFLTGFPALTRNLPDAVPNGTANAVTEWGGEIAHVRQNGCTVFRLHPDDVAEVIQSGWGQRSPLAVMNEGWIWRNFHHRLLRTHTPLPHNTVIVYPPANKEETIVFNYILEAAIWWAKSQPNQ